jgi:hypothetical protein
LGPIVLVLERLERNDSSEMKDEWVVDPIPIDELLKRSYKIHMMKVLGRISLDFFQSSSYRGYWIQVNFGVKDIYSETRGHVLTLFFGKRVKR